MVRLIDADEFKKQIAGMAIVNNYPPEKANALCELIDAQPTAFDLNKVVEQLEKERNPIYRTDESLMGSKSNIKIDKAIDIVKAGGVDG